MSDLEQRLTDALIEGGQGAPSATGLASAARARARRKRRARIAGGAALVALAIGVPGAVVALSGDDAPGRSVGPADRGETAVDGKGDDGGDAQVDVPSLESGYHWESWHGVSIQVPDSWTYGSLSDWCADGGDPETPRIQRPGTVSELVMCDPSMSYGLSFQEIDNHDDFEWPVVHQSGDGWPKENVSGGRGIGGVLVTVTTRTSAEASYILYSMHAIPATGDANGCQYRLRPDEISPPEGALSVCRYDEQGQLEQSEALVGEDAGDAVRVLQDAPEPGECADTSQGSQPHQVIILESAGISARVDLVNGCPRVTVDGHVRELTSDVLYWALSPGWSGSVPDGVSLPSELRKE